MSEPSVRMFLISDPQSVEVGKLEITGQNALDGLQIVRLRLGDFNVALTVELARKIGQLLIHVADVVDSKEADGP